jgi:glutamate 5-kinase
MSAPLQVLAPPAATPRLADARRVVIKVGSALLVDPDRAAPRADWLHGVAADIACLRAAGT